MSANIYGENVYSLKTKMWHALGTVGLEGESAIAIYSRMTPVEFDLRQFSIPLNGEEFLGKDFGIVRISGDKEVLVGRTLGRYTITQPKTYCEIFDTTIGQEVETLGFLGTHGERMFLTWKLPAIDVHGDIVELYGFLAVGMDGKFGEKLFMTNVRVVCNNTWNLAISSADGKNGGKNSAVYSGKHNTKEHEKHLAIWMSYIQGEAEKQVSYFQGLYRKMEETKIKIDTAYNLFAKVYPYAGEIGSFFPNQLRGEKQAKIDEYNTKAEASRDLAVELFSGKGMGINRTLWGAYQSVTEAANHWEKSKKPIANSVLLGNRHDTMTNALQIISSYKVK